MPKKKSSRRKLRQKNKGWISFWLAVLVIAFIGSTIYYLFYSHVSSTGNVQGVTTATGSGQLRPSPTSLPKPSVYLSSETLTRSTCFPAFKKIEFTCTDGFRGALDPTDCASPQLLLKTAELTCLKRGTPTATPSAKPSIVITLQKPQSATTTTR